MPMLWGPLEPCPHCGRAASYGRCLIERNDLLYRCQHCLAMDRKPLPRVKKKVIYIDQFALSNMVKPKADPFWGDLYSRLLDLAAKNLITCPSSPIHVEESRFSATLREGLKGLYCELAGSDKFKRPREIEKAQMARLLKQFMGLAESEQDPEWTDWADENPDRWADFFHVHVDFDIDEDLVEWLRADKVRFCDEMAGQYEVWRQNPQPFDEDVKSNLASWMSSLLKERAWLAEWLVRWVQAIDRSETEPMSVVVEFLKSGIWVEAPYLVRWVRVWAKIAELARNPKGPRKPQRGDAFDSQVLSYYAAHCDAMFIDKGFCSIATDPRVCAPGPRGTHFFSEQSRDGFLRYLDGINDGMSQEHREALAFVYGD
jgi:hypothetical protein